MLIHFTFRFINISRGFRRIKTYFSLDNLFYFRLYTLRDFKVGMCNSDRVLEYWAVTAMIGGKNISDWLKQHFGRHPEL